MQELNARHGVTRTATHAATRGATRRRGWAAMRVAVLLCAGMATLTSTQAWAQSDAVKELAAPPAIQLPLKPSPEFARFPRYVGMLGARQIVLRLGAKTDDPSGVHGEYQFTDTGEVILIAGDHDGDTLEVEESNDGTHITGNWVGKFAADGSVAGDRMNVDDSDPQPFDLKPLAAGQAVPPPGAPASATAAVGANEAAAAPQASVGGVVAAPGSAPANGGHAVGGVGNLQTGE
ncbi:hypothetical protein bAD24_I02815 [Burkholderia sp. AD24]|nr:hypothetical protein bAD24_I02815 [Burkholderia sp. AD24]